jgi:aldehyde dehydrogenase (NAD+)
MRTAPTRAPTVARQLFIDGAWQDSDENDYTEIVNPATEEIIATVPRATRSDMRRAIAAARRAFDEGPWPTMPVRKRAAALLRLGEIMESRRDELVELNIGESGSTRLLAEQLQVGVPLKHMRDMAERVMVSFPFEQPVMPTIGRRLSQGVVRREPFGVAALISAYNFPFFLNVLKLAPALAAGCTVVLKPAPATPLEALIIGEFAEQAELPPGVLNVVCGDIDAGIELTTNPMVDLISFTGSDTVGRQVYEQAAATMKKVVLELGGKSANIICDDADLGAVVPDVLRGMVTHAGQGCGLLTRTLVHASRFDELVGMLAAALSRVTVGDPAQRDTGMGPLISAAQRAKVEALIETGQREGAEIAYGGGRPSGLAKGFFVEPTLFVDVDNSMTIAQREIFGPVGVVIPFEDDDHAVALANDSLFGLAGGVWARNPVRAYGIAARLRTGLVGLNGGGGGVTPHLPFGGYKHSGLGREWGAAGLEEYLQTKAIAWDAANG